MSDESSSGLQIDYLASAEEARKHLNEGDFFSFFDDVDQVMGFLKVMPMSSDEATKFTRQLHDAVNRQVFTQEEAFNLYNRMQVNFTNDLVSISAFIGVSKRFLKAQPIKNLDAVVVKMLSEKSEMDEAKEKMERDAKKNERTLTEKRKKVEDQKKEIQNLKNKLSKLQKDEKSSNTEKQSLERALNDANRENQELKRKTSNQNTAALEQEIRKKDQSIAATRNEITTKANQITDMHNKIKSAKQDINAKKVQIQNLKSTNQQKKQRINNLSNDLSYKTAEYRNAHNRLKDKHEQVKQLTTEINRLKKTAREVGLDESDDLGYPNDIPRLNIQNPQIANLNDAGDEFSFSVSNPSELPNDLGNVVYVRPAIQRTADPPQQSVYNQPQRPRLSDSESETNGPAVRTRRQLLDSESESESRAPRSPQRTINSDANETRQRERSATVAPSVSSSRRQQLDSASESESRAPRSPQRKVIADNSDSSDTNKPRERARASTIAPTNAPNRRREISDSDNESETSRSAQYRRRRGGRDSDSDDGQPTRSRAQSVAPSTTLRGRRAQIEDSSSD